MESQRPILRYVLIGLVVFTVVLVILGNMYRTPLKTVNIVNETSETITITTTAQNKVRVFSAPTGGRANVPLDNQDEDCSEQSFKIRTPSRRTATLEGQFCQDENHPVRESDLVTATD
ncbi:MAG: hypothetical protein M3Y20_05495 [Actinomycetota bacterium]|nr:hypothetical protein [Actinomycetota bacterium]